MAAAVILICLIVAVLIKSKNESSSLSDDTAREYSAESFEAADAAALSDDFVSYDYDAGLLVYGGSALDALSWPEFFICDAGIIFYETNYSEASSGYVDFYMFDPESGSITAQNSFECEFLTDIRQTDKGIMFCDSSLGYARLIDENLQELEVWTFEPNYSYWYISCDGSGLYRINDDCTLSLTDLESGSEQTLLTGTADLYGAQAINGGACITYVNSSQMTVFVWLDLSDSSLSENPFDEALNTLTFDGETWLANMEGYPYTNYILGSGQDDALFISPEDGSLSQIEGSGLILLSSEDTLALYDTGGAFVSSCSIDADTLWFYSDYCIYSENFGGFFILAYSDYGPELLFWDTDSNASGQDLETVSLSEYETVSAGTGADADLYERAAALGEEYGIEILIADQCSTEYTDFTAEQLIDDDLISESLDILEEALSNYPEGFFEQLKYDQVSKIEINLMGTITATNSNWGDESYNGFTEENGNTNVMVLDMNQLYADTVYHEMSHIIDKKLEWDAYCRSNALFSEDTWASLNPDGFEYEYVYSGFDENYFEDDEYLYFIDTYSMISPTEDRARILEYAMAGYTTYFSDYEPTKIKLAYYCECIRDAFDTEGWPETTVWEAALY